MSSEEYQAYEARRMAKKPAPPEPRDLPSQPERELHDKIIAACRRLGLPFIHSRTDLRTTIHVGAPDFVIALPERRTLWIECKSAKGKLRPEQQGWLRHLKKLGHEAAVVRSHDEFLTYVYTFHQP